MAIFRKVLEEDSSSPFIARLFLGVLDIRGLLAMSQMDAFRRISEREFDKEYNPLFESLKATKRSAEETINLIYGHRKSVLNGNAIREYEGNYIVDEIIDDQLNQYFGNFLDEGVIAYKDCLQNFITNIYGFDIGFLFGKPKPFAKGIIRLRSEGNNTLADYIESVRNEWSENFIKLRNNRHGGWRLPRLEYELWASGIGRVKFLTVNGLLVENFTTIHANRIFRFVEDIIAYGFQQFYSSTIYLSEIPKESQDPSCPKRFKTSAKGLGSDVPWDLVYQDELDFI